MLDKHGDAVVMTAGAARTECNLDLIARINDWIVFLVPAWSVQVQVIQEVNHDCFRLSF